MMAAMNTFGNGDRIEFFASTDEYNLMQVPIQSEWRCEIAGLTYIPEKGREPNRFHRFMQRVCFGTVWTRRTPRTPPFATAASARSN
jgi:rubredoxin